MRLEFRKYRLIVKQDFELCVPSVDLYRAARALQAHSDSYKRLPDCEDPDFYHRYRRGAKRFQIVCTQPPVELFLVSDNSLGMIISANTMEFGLTADRAHNELREYCEGVTADALARITWPSLAGFLEGWLNLSIKAAGFAEEVVYLMYAERVIDANGMDDGWCEMNFKDGKVAEVAKRILAGKENRIMQDTWE